MRLLHVRDLKVEAFESDAKLPPYAILSHTWGDGEVSFQDIQTPNAAASMAGYSKIVKCCEIAERDGFDYVWVDTCCIDKTSSAELSEAINSMFQWYRSASVCYAYLSDVDREHVDSADEWSPFRRSRWFSRGWTLQELLAPDIVVFYNRNWIDIGTKRMLQDVITDITGISRDALLDVDYMRKHTSIATRMSWAAMRRTTRVEDIAYSLMGIFDVNMPPLYGEGTNAFMRLQLEIIKNNKDESIFAWGNQLVSSWDRYLYDGSRECGMLGDSPSAFQNSRGMSVNVLRQHSPRPFSMSNIGLHVWLPAIRRRGLYGEDYLQVVLNCRDTNGMYVSILLALDDRSGHWRRYSNDVYLLDEEELNKVDDPIELYIAGSPRTMLDTRYRRQSQIKYQFIRNTSPETGYVIDSGETTSSSSENQSLTWNFNNSEPQKSSFHMNYLIVKSLAEPSIKATIALGVWKDRLTNKLTHHCRVFPGANTDITTSLMTISGANPTVPSPVSDSESDQRTSNFFTLFAPDNRNQYFPNDKLIHRLPSGRDILVITVRTGPLERIHPRMYRHLHLVEIGFSQDRRLFNLPTVPVLESKVNNGEQESEVFHASPRLVGNRLRFGRIVASGMLWVKRFLSL